MAPYEQGRLPRNCLLVGDHPSASFHTIRRGSTVFQLESQVYGEKPPKQFALKDGIVALRGVSPDIDVEASELEVRSAIADVIKNSGDEFIACSRYSFEFIEANSKNLYVPAKHPSFQWSGKAVKNLAGNGQVYVRLLFDTSSSESEDVPQSLPRRNKVVVRDELPSCSFSGQSGSRKRHSALCSSTFLVNLFSC